MGVPILLFLNSVFSNGYSKHTVEFLSTFFGVFRVTGIYIIVGYANI